MISSEPSAIFVPTDHDLLGACLNLAEAPSLVELERRLDTWLARLYAPVGWSLAWPTHDRDETIIEMHDGRDWRSGVLDIYDHAIQVPLRSGVHEPGTLKLRFDSLHSAPDQYNAGLDQLAQVLGNRLSRLHTELQSLARSAELFFVRSLLQGSAPESINRNLDELANSLLAHLDCSSFQVLIDQGGAGGRAWGISERRCSVALEVEDRQRLLQLADALLREQQKRSTTHILVHSAQLRALERQYDLAYLKQFQSMLITPILHNKTFVGAVIASEQRTWSRQSISRQATAVCSLIARSIAEAMSQSRLLADVIDRSRSMQALIDGLSDAVLTIAHGAITSWNRAAHKLFGYRAEEVLGRSICDVFPGAPARICGHHVPNSGLDQAEPAITWTMQTADGRGLYLSCSITKLYNDGLRCRRSCMS